MSTATDLMRIPGLAVANRPAPGAKLVSLSALGFLPDIAGAEEFNGMNQETDVIITQTKDGVDLNQMWREFQDALRLQNAERQAIIDFLTFPVVEPMESVTQLSGARFELATEYGEPRGIRQKPKSFFLGYGFDFYDIAIRFTWRFLARASAQQVEALHASAIAADNQLQFEKVMEALYNDENRETDIEEQAVPVYALYNGDGTVPPNYKTNTFDGTHNHYLTSGAAAITPGDLDDLSEHLRHHGYSSENGVQQLIAVNSREGRVIRGFRIADGATYDFIPAMGETLALVLEPGQTVSGGRPASTYRGLKVIGSYGEMLVIEDDNFPASYVAIIGSGGRANLNNPVGLREDENPQLRGLRLVKGPDNNYPLTDSFYLRGLGTGIRQRGGAAIMQITTNVSYTPPAQYVV